MYRYSARISLFESLTVAPPIDVVHPRLQLREFYFIVVDQSKAPHSANKALAFSSVEFLGRFVPLMVRMQQTGRGQAKAERCAP